MSATAERADAVATLIRSALGLDVTLGPLLEDPNAQSSAVMVGLTPYPVMRNAETGQDVEGVQVRIRARKNIGNRALWDAQDAVWDLLVGTSNGTNIPGVAVAWRNSATPVVPDSAGRNQVFDSYYLRTDRLGQTG